MGIAQMERVFFFCLCTVLVASCLQLLTTIEAMPLLADDADYNVSGSYENQTHFEVVDCQCNETNLTMTVDGHFLFQWRTFNTHHSIRHLSESAAKLVDDTNDLQTKFCYSEYSSNFNLDYHYSQPVTHPLLRKFYNAFILHKRFIKEKLLTFWRINKNHRTKLTNITGELNKNIARLYHVLNISGCECVPEDCEQTTIAFEQVVQSTKDCFMDYNLPINDVARKIRDDANELVKVIEKLQEENPKSDTDDEHSFNYAHIKANVMVDKRWCHY